MSDLFTVGGEKTALAAAGKSVTRQSFTQAIRTHAARWIIQKNSWLPRALAEHAGWRGQHRALVFRPLHGLVGELFFATFRTVLNPGDAIRLLSSEVLIDVLHAPRPELLFIGGGVVPRQDVLMFYRGNLERLVVPKSWFKKSGSNAPDFNDLEIIDYGQTVRLGRFEAAVDAILYDHDNAARRYMKKIVLANDSSLGAALKRLRLQRKLRREDFAGVTAKSIARIERGEVKHPRAATLALIAKQLDVEPNEIINY